ncbi:MAG: hypothetical protein ACYDC3_09010 [Candidatus Binataceae bacterium]
MKHLNIVSYLRLLQAASFALLFSGCGQTIYISKLTPTTLSPEAENAFVFPRQCDANRASSDPSWWLRIKCMGEPSLPAECEGPGTYKLPACEGWLLSQAARQQQQQAVTQAVINATSGPVQR